MGLKEDGLHRHRSGGAVSQCGCPGAGAGGEAAAFLGCSTAERRRKLWVLDIFLLESAAAHHREYGHDRVGCVCGGQA